MPRKDRASRLEYTKAYYEKNKDYLLLQRKVRMGSYTPEERTEYNTKARERYAKRKSEGFNKHESRLGTMSEEELAVYKEKRRAVGKRYYEKNKEKINEKGKTNRDRNRLRMYGLTVEDYYKMFEKQNKVCAICKTDKPVTISTRPLVVDHCHKANKVRGLLCSQCNVMLGMASDNPKVLASAIKYLQENEE